MVYLKDALSDDISLTFDDVGDSLTFDGDLVADKFIGEITVVLGSDENYVTDVEKTIITNTSGSNTGDQNLSGKENVGIASGLLSTHTTSHPVPTTRDARNEIAKGSNDNYVTDVEKTIITNTLPITYSTITSDMLLTDNIPAGYALTSILFEETVGNNITINIGSTNGGTEILYNETLTASSSKLFIFNRFFSSSTTQTIDINSSDWNSASLNITIKLSPVTV